MGDFTFEMFASWRLERLERDFSLDCLVFGLMPCNFHKRRHKNDAKVKHSASLINKCLWTWEPSKKEVKIKLVIFQNGYHQILVYSTYIYRLYIYAYIYIYILLIICVCANLSLSLCMSSFSSSSLRPSPKPLPGHNEISLARQGADSGDVFRMDPIESN